MKHLELETLRDEADVRKIAISLTRRERLERWADLLDAQSSMRLSSLYQLEHLPAEERRMMRVSGSPFALAYADPEFRADGLESDRYGDVITYFGLSDRQAHQLFCSCLNGGTLTTGHLASALRRLATQGEVGINPMAWLMPVAGFGITASVLAATILLG